MAYHGISMAAPVMATVLDQGQIALKLRGFERAVTVLGGLPIPTTTPAHGTAFDIVGKGTANVRAFQAALRMPVRMVRGIRHVQ
jgi:4-hydroxythreonine-4-phosphate dehydrogenase